MKAKRNTDAGNKHDFIVDLESMLPPERTERARREAEKAIFRIKLSALRKTMKVRQEDITAFSQSGISKLEKRNDMKISTLIEYLDSIGMGMEIRTFPKKTAERPARETRR